MAHTWTGTHRFVEGDIADCFGSLDHQVMVAILAEKIHDGRFLKLIERILKAGYLEDWRWNATLSGAPQGGVASPILSNIYLDRLDQFVEQQLIPEYTRGELRRRTPAYARLQYQIAVGKRLGDRETVSALRRQLRQLPSGDPNDPGYRRLKYVRYCDDFLLGFAGPKREAEEIKARIQGFLREELRLTLSDSKTLITHAANQAARFLGYEIKVQQADTKITSGKRSINGRVGLFVPRAVIRERCAKYMRKGKPVHRGLMVHDQDYTIVAQYGAEYRGFVQYYLLAQNVHHLGRLRRVMEVSLFKTLAAKHKSTVNKMARKYKTVIETPDGPRTCCEAVVQRDNGRKPLIARFGGIPLKRKRAAIITDIKPTMAVTKRNELIHRLLVGQCEICEGLTGLQVHHVRKLADLNRPGRSERPVWVRVMAMRKRKTLVVCERCHQDIHAGRATVTLRKSSLESRVRLKPPARFGKGPSEKDPSHGHLVGGLLHSSGSYFPPPVKAVEIPKPHGGTRVLGVPTVADRVAQTVVAMELEKRVEPMFHPDSYGYRPRRSALDAVKACRKRCWEYGWVVDLDIQKFFDSVDHALMVKAVEANTDQPWVVLYVKRWLVAPIQCPDGSLQERHWGTPQGSAVSPVLANLFLHYAFDMWMDRTFPKVRFERYVDDAVVHCRSQHEAEMIREALGQRMADVGLTLHPDKTRIVYCKDSNRRGKHDNISFGFLGYTFRPRRAWNKRKRVRFTSFQPAMSREKRTEKTREVRRWRLHRRPSDSLGDLADAINPIVRGWMTYWGRFYREEMIPLLKRINTYLMRWARKKYKRLRGFKRLKAWWDRITQRKPDLFAHWAWTHRFHPTGW